MAKIRVFEAAKQHGREVQDLLAVLTELGVKVRSHLTPVDEEDLQKALEKLGVSATTSEVGPKVAAAPKRVVRRRRKMTEDGTEPEVAPGETEVPVEPVSPEPDTTGDTGPEEAEPAAGDKQETQTSEEEAGEESVEVAETSEEAADTPKEELKLKVVRFIHQLPGEPTAPASPAGPAPGYHRSKQEREAQRQTRRTKKKRGRREEVRDVRKRTGGQKTQITVPKAIKRKIRIDEVISVSDLSQRMGVKSTELIKQLMTLGVLTTINQTIDADTASLVATEFDYEIENITVGEEEILTQAEDRPEDLVPRPPVVTVMGHVDHGKTSLLDAIRKTRVADGEAGGITQHIGAYEVETSRGRLVFLDTPGHEAFTSLRARGAQLTDITVLVVAADDGIMPQTVEAIDHSKAANVPIIVAINKMDRPDANPDHVKRGLTEHELAPEDWGGDIICVPISAKKGTGIEELLEMIALQAEIMELRANPDKAARGIVIEARVDRGRGPVATVLVQEGTLKVGDVVLAGPHFGRVRALVNDQGKRVEKATPSIPAEIIGLGGIPTAGEPFVVMENERVAKQVATKRHEQARGLDMVKAQRVSLDDLHERLAQGEIQDLPIIIKADVQGSVEALTQTLEKLSNPEVHVKVIHGSVGGITENDVNLAGASNAIIIGFSVRPESKAAALASQLGVDLRLYKVIYDASDDVKKAIVGLLAPTIEEQILGRADVRQIFRVPKAGTVAGCFVTEGLVQRAAKVRLLRDNVIVYEGELASLKRFKDDAKEVRDGFECGLSIANYNDLKEGDVLEFYKLVEIARTLD